jgi:hypothetical protein
VTLDLRGTLPVRQIGPDGRPILGATRSHTDEGFVFPFDQEGIVTVTRGIPVRWSVVEEGTARVVPPVVRGLPEGIEVASVVPDETSVRLRGPHVFFQEAGGAAEIQPDPVDASRWLKDKPELSTLWTEETGFDQWRGQDPLRHPSVLRITPERVRVKVKFRRVAGRPFERMLAVGWHDPRSADTHTYEIARSPEYAPERNVLTATLVGDPQVLDRLATRPEDVKFILVLPRPPETAGGPPLQVPVLLWVPPDARVAFEKPLVLFVTVRPKG